MSQQIALVNAAYKNKLVNRFVMVDYADKKTGQQKTRYGKVLSLDFGPMGNNITVDTQDGPKTLPLANMETAARFITEEAFRAMFPQWEAYKPKD